VRGDMLRDLGVTDIRAAANGNDGAAALDRMAVPPDLVVCDLNMPGEDGFQFMERLGKRGFTGGVILVSGLDARILNSASLMARFHRLTFLATLTKPVEATALRAAIARLS
jgi:CheY-like chemotaxis protein